jgi:hypothetical protein
MPAAAAKNNKGGTHSTRSGKDGKTRLGAHAGEYCDENQAYGHSTDKCYKRKNAKQAAAAQTDPETPRSAQLAQVDQSDPSDDEVVADFLAITEPAAFVSTAKKYTLVVDSGVGTDRHQG